MWDGVRKLGQRRTDEERRARHKALYGTTNLPPRGSGLQQGLILGRGRGKRNRNS